jgi:hypothetical protein
MDVFNEKKVVKKKRIPKRAGTSNKPTAKRKK